MAGKRHPRPYPEACLVRKMCCRRPTTARLPADDARSPHGCLNVRNRRTQVVLWGTVAVLLGLWILGWLMQLGGKLIHILLVVAVIVLAVQFLTGGQVGF